MDELRRRALLGPLLAGARAGKPYLGICLGMQILFDEGEEFGRHAGMGLLPGRVVRFAAGDLRIPHLGWNEVRLRRRHPVLSAAPGAFFYFVHSYYVAPSDPGDVVAETDYGGPFASCVGRGSVFGCQFHPEKSQAAGLRLLDAFARWCP
jgi:glutamine amidotransferase